MPIYPVAVVGKYVSLGAAYYGVFPHLPGEGLQDSRFYLHLLSRELQTVVGTAGLQLRAPDLTVSARRQRECQHICQKVCQTIYIQLYTYISNIYFQMACQKLYQKRSEKCVRVGINRRKFVFLEFCFLSVLPLSSVDADYLPPCCFLISSYTIPRKARYRPLLHSLKSPWKGSMTWPTATRTRAVSKP